MVAGIYLITNKINGHRYVGGSLNIERRFKEHKRGTDANSQAIDKAILKYGKNNFTYQIITELPADWKVISQHEKYWIKFYNTFQNKKHYNLTEGGDDVVLWKENHPMLNKKHTKESKLQISKNRKGKCIGKDNPMWNKKHDKKTIKKMQEKKKGKNNPRYRHDIPTPQELFNEYNSSNITYKELAAKYNCGVMTIQRRIKKAKDSCVKN